MGSARLKGVKRGDDEYAVCEICGGRVKDEFHLVGDPKDMDEPFVFCTPCYERAFPEKRDWRKGPVNTIG